MEKDGKIRKNNQKQGKIMKMQENHYKKQRKHRKTQETEVKKKIPKRKKKSSNNFLPSNIWRTEKKERRNKYTGNSFKRKTNEKNVQTRNARKNVTETHATCFTKKSETAEKRETETYCFNMFPDIAFWNSCACVQGRSCHMTVKFSDESKPNSFASKYYPCAATIALDIADPCASPSIHLFFQIRKNSTNE